MSRVGVIKASKRLYYNQVFYHSSHSHQQTTVDIHIIFTWNTEAHIRYVSNKYGEQQGFHASVHQVVQLVEDVVQVGLERGRSTKVMDGQWQIHPIKSMVTKTEIDDFKPGRGIPSCLLKARSLCEDYPQLLHQITLSGIKPPYDELTLSYMPPSIKDTSATLVKSAPSGTATPLKVEGSAGSQVDQSPHPPTASTAAKEIVTFDSSMSDEDFLKWLRSKGMNQKDSKSLSDNDITAAGFLQYDVEDFDDIGLTKFGKKLLLKIFSELKERGKDSYEGSRGHVPRRSRQARERGTRLHDKDHSAIYSKLEPHATKWRDIGIALGFKIQELDNILSTPWLLGQAPLSWLKQMLTQWLKWAPGDGRGSTGSPTKEALRTALLQANLGVVAQRFQ